MIRREPQARVSVVDRSVAQALVAGAQPRDGLAELAPNLFERLSLGLVTRARRAGAALLALVVAR